MMNYRAKLERSVALIPSAAALSAEDRAALVEALESLVGQHSENSESPELKKRFAALTEIQGQLRDLETDFFKERTALKAKQKRFQDQEGHNYKLYTLKNNEVLAKEITKYDEEALKNLRDIKYSRIANSKEFKMEFIFRDNLYFDNSVLIKTYHMTIDDKPILEKAIGTKIKWYPGKILTENCHSFFNFFQPVQAADVQSRMHRDYDIFSTIRDEIIPQWHQMNTGESSRNSLISFNYRRREKLLKKIFLAERALLEGKYQKLYEPLYKKRYEIVNDTTEVQETKNRTAVDQDKAREENGVPYFWAIAMKNDEVLAKKITKCDEGALKYLKDIKWCRTNNSKGFKLEFFFDSNPYFKNTILTKTYHMSSDDSRPMLEKTIGTKIKWHPGKSLTASLLTMPRKRSKLAEFITKQQSFFNFFNTPLYPMLPWDSSTYMYHDSFAKIRNQFDVQRDLDYEVGKTIRDKVIPHAVSLFTGKAVGQGNDYEDPHDDDDCYSVDEDGEEDADQHTEFSSSSDDDEEEKEVENDGGDQDCRTGKRMRLTTTYNY